MVQPSADIEFQCTEDLYKSVLFLLSYDVASECELMLCIKIDKPLVVYRFSQNVMKWRF